MQNRHSFLERFLLAVGILALCVLSYGLLINKMGFFLDDWYIILTNKVFGAAKFTEFFKGDRPLFAYVYQLFIPLLGDNPLSWQIFAIIGKTASALLFWLLLDMILPARNALNYLTVALFAIYPGFKFHFFAVMYSQNYILLCAYLLSYILMVLAFRKPKKAWFLVPLAMVCQFVGIAPMEYFYGLELFRPVLIYLIVRAKQSDKKKALKHSLLHYLPYMLVFLGFTLFRVLMASQYSYQMGLLTQFKANPVKTLFDLGVLCMRALLDAGILVWYRLADIFETVNGTSFAPILYGLLVAVSLLGLLTLRVFFKQDMRREKPYATIGLLLLSVFLMLVALIPFVIGGLVVSLDFPENRFLLALAPGAALFITTLADLALRNNKLKFIFLSILLGLSVVSNYLTGREYKDAWADQQRFWQQMTWRAPAIKENTLLLTTVTPFEKYFSGGSLNAPVNLIYAPENNSNPIPYQFLQLGTTQRLQFSEFGENMPINKVSRVFRFEGNSSDSLTLYFPEKGCLQILDPKTDPKLFKNDRNYDVWKEIIPLSNLSRIVTDQDQATLPFPYFPLQEEDDWCYYYEKMSLAAQQENWDEISRLFIEAESKRLAPTDPGEYYPVIRSLIARNEKLSALDTSSRLNPNDPVLRAQLCGLWQKTLEDPNWKDQRADIGIVLEKLECENR